MTQEQAIQEAKDRVAKKKAYSSFQTWKSDLSENFSDPKAALIKFMEEVVIEYSSSQLEAAQKQSEKWETNYLKVVSDKGIEISNLKDKLEAKDREIEELKDFNSNALNEIGKLGAQLQQATASSGERGDGEIYGKVFVKDRTPIDLKYYHTNDGTCRYSEAYKQWLTDDNEKRNPSYWLEPLPPPSTKRFSLEDKRGIEDAISMFNIMGIDKDLIKKYPEIVRIKALLLKSLTPSEHTEVKEVVMGRNSSVTKSKWSESLKVNAPESKAGEGKCSNCGTHENVKDNLCEDCFEISKNQSSGN